MRESPETKTAFRARLCAATLGALSALTATGARCGAWLMPPGEGQLIAGAAFSGSTRAFDSRGRLVPVPDYQKFELGAYLEYGLTDRVTLVAAPAYDRVRQPAPLPSTSGLGESGAGARFGIFEANGFVASAQATLLTSGLSFNGALASPRRAASLDLRGLAGYGFALGAMPAFVGAEAGYRFYAQGQPGGWRFDFALGVRPVEKLLVLMQGFGELQTEGSASFPSSAWEKLQLSLVYEFAARWSVQLGGFFTVAGRNAGRELGPVAAVWWRF
ncbi:hypothetical protein [Methylocella sp.]|uniref:hypothetical protein n=1 Tax=Methylocella sp. TaxID=1978226 RepID=UPI003783D6DE